MKIHRPVLKPIEKDKFELFYPYIFNGITVPKGYKTNGANIPRIFWSIFPPNSPEYLSAAVVHDYLCETAKNNQDRLHADQQFKLCLECLGVNKLKRLIFYYSVRIYHIFKYGGH